MASTPPVEAQATISVDGLVESTSGGLEFPNGTVQTTTALAGSAPVADTGQRLCWDADGNGIDCSFAGHDGTFQAGVAWPTPRFTSSGGVVTDHLTSLQWLEDADCLPGKTDWSTALLFMVFLSTGALDTCENYTPGTFGDWRLPSIKELLSLVDYGSKPPSSLFPLTYPPALPIDHPFTNVRTDGPYWSSTTTFPVTVAAWTVDFAAGTVDTGGKPTFSGYIWPVRAGQ